LSGALSNNIPTTSYFTFPLNFIQLTALEILSFNILSVAAFIIHPTVYSHLPTLTFFNSIGEAPGGIYPSELTDGTWNLAYAVAVFILAKSVQGTPISPGPSLHQRGDISSDAVSICGLVASIFGVLITAKAVFR